MVYYDTCVGDFGTAYNVIRQQWETNLLFNTAIRMHTYKTVTRVARGVFCLFSRGSLGRLRLPRRCLLQHVPSCLHVSSHVVSSSRIFLEFVSATSTHMWAPRAPAFSATCSTVDVTPTLTVCGGVRYWYTKLSSSHFHLFFLTTATLIYLIRVEIKRSTSSLLCSQSSELRLFEYCFLGYTRTPLNQMLFLEMIGRCCVTKLVSKQVTLSYAFLLHMHF